MTIAGIYDVWSEPHQDEHFWSCAMVITEPNKVTAKIHDRMPVILGAKDFEQWERGDVDAAALMTPAAEDVLQMWPVSKRVNNSRADGDDATLIERISAAAPD